jgi:two-component system LytT family sensor kinase
MYNSQIFINQIKSIIMENNKTYESAKRKAGLLKELYSHLSTYLFVNGILFLVNYLTSPGDWWVLYPLIGWGVCLTIHGIDTIVKVSGFWDKWEYRKTEEIMHKERDNYQNR